MYRVESVSMLPALHPNTVVLVNLHSYKNHNPEVNDIVVLLDPLSAERKLIKRVTHIPGETVSFVQSTNAINETTRTPMIIRNKTTWEDINGYFIQGDNAQHSTDSRQFGVVPLQNIVGKVVFSF